MLQAHGQIVSVMYGIEQIGNLAGIADDMDILGSGNVEGNALYKANSLHNGVSFQLDFLAFFRENRYAVLIGAYYLSGGIDRHLVILERITQETGIRITGTGSDQDVVHSLDNLDLLAFERHLIGDFTAGNTAADHHDFVSCRLTVMQEVGSRDKALAAGKIQLACFKRAGRNDDFINACKFRQVFDLNAEANINKLSRTKPLHKITVKDICDDANINRGTFYKYYCDIIELGKALEREAAERFASAIVDEYRFDANSDVCREGLFRCVKEYPDDAYILFSLGSIDKPNRATDILYELLREKALPEWIRKSYISGEQAEIIFYHTIHSMFNLLILWNSGKVTMEEAEFKKLFSSLIRHGTYHLIYTR